MLEAYDAATVRAAEAPLIAAGTPLMDRAAFALAREILAALRYRRGRASGARVTVLVGPGNNGGDGLFAAAYLARRGVACHALLLADRWHEAGAQALRAAGGRLTRVTSVADAVPVATDCDALIDAILGTGTSANPALRGTAHALVSAVVQRLAVQPGGPLVVAVDQPSGVGTDNGAVPQPDAVLRADITVTMGAAKPALLLPPAAAFSGRVVVEPIGLAEPIAAAGRPAVRQLDLADLALQELIAVPAATAQKYTRGVLGVVAGTAAFPGAAVMACESAVRAGLGMVRYVGPQQVSAAVVAHRPEVVPAAGRVRAWLVGPGLPAWDRDHTPSSDASQYDAARSAIDAAVGSLPLVVDAGGIGLLPAQVPATVLITPHAGELERLFANRGVTDPSGAPVTRTQIEADPARWATVAHHTLGATVLLKGSTTVVAGVDGLWAQHDATSWLATAGAGDVLSGILGALLATHSAAALADPALVARLAAAGALIHGQAARWAAGQTLPAGWAIQDRTTGAGLLEPAAAGHPIAASDVSAAIPAVLDAALAAG